MVRTAIKRLRYLGYAISSVVILFGLFITGERLSGNFHEVVPGELYRSAQLKPGDITQYQRAYKVRTVLNLRGNNSKEAWYKSEVNEAKALGVEHIDFAMSAKHELTDEQALQLIKIMRDAPKPLLIHCYGGADRTGLATALYMAAIHNSSEWAAERQMWLNYGHWAFSYQNSSAMNRTFERLEPLLGFSDS